MPCDALRILLSAAILALKFSSLTRSPCRSSRPFLSAFNALLFIIGCLTYQTSGTKNFSHSVCCKPSLLLAVARNHRPKMGKKKTAVEKVKAARERGFNDDMTGIDDRPVLRKILGYSEGLYEVQMEVWRE